MHGLLEIVFLNNANREARAHLNASDPGRKEQRRAEADLAEAIARISGALFGQADEQPENECDGCPAIDLGLCDGKGSENAAPVTGKANRFPPDFSVIRHADEVWVLPLTSTGQTIAAKIIPEGTRRYGMHYILTGDEGFAIAASIEAAN